MVHARTPDQRDQTCGAPAEGHPAAEPCWRSESSSRASEGLHKLAEEHQQADDEAKNRPRPGLDPLTTPRFSRAAVQKPPLWGKMNQPSFVAVPQSS
jgi:hypothetical protein